MLQAWREQVWGRSAADPADWPEGRFCGPTISPLGGDGGRVGGASCATSQAFATAEEKSRLASPYPNGGLIDPYPVRPAVGDEPTARLQ